ncbi:MAG: DUF4388 domain-containing protein [Candidatus Dormibacteria bacterium]
MQNQGTLRPSTVAELLQTMQQERATGTLSLANNGSQCSLHFLFGHLFHASGGSGEGEPAVIDALGWDDGQYNFNPRAKLPPEETVNSSTEDLLAQWRRSREARSRAPEVKVNVTAHRAIPAPAKPAPEEESEGDDVDWLDTVAAAEIDAEVEEPAEIPAFQAPRAPLPTPGRAEAPLRVPRRATPQPAAASAQANRPGGGNVLGVGRAVLATGGWSPGEQLSGSVPRQSAQGAAKAPAPAGSRPSAAGARPVPGATPHQLSLLIPLPAGSILHGGLKASFLNFPMLLRTLSQDGFSGYISITGEKEGQSVGHIMFRDGAIVQAQQRGGGGYRRHKVALQELVRTVAAGDGLIDAVEVPSQLVESVSGLVVGATRFYHLPSRIVDFEALVGYLEEQALNGGILVSSGKDSVAVVVLSEGRAKGSYSSDSRELSEGAEAAANACADREACIDVVSSPAAPLSPIDLAEIA